jgi:hypothetical protein
METAAVTGVTGTVPDCRRNQAGIPATREQAMADFKKEWFN